MNICERIIKIIREDIKVFEICINKQQLDKQYYNIEGALDIIYNINILSINECEELCRLLAHEYDYHKDRIGEIVK